MHHLSLFDMPSMNIMSNPLPSIQCLLTSPIFHNMTWKASYRRLARYEALVV